MQIANFARMNHLARQIVTDDLAQAVRGREKRVEIDAGLVVHAVQHVHQVFGANVARGTWSERTTSQPAEAAFVVNHSSGKTGQYIRKPHATRVMKVQRQLELRPTLARFPREAFHLTRIGHACRIAKGYAGDTQSDAALTADPPLRLCPRAFHGAAE